MAAFWTWCVRNPALLLAAAGLLASLAGVADWPLGSMAVLVGATVADVAHRRARRARRRARLAAIAIETDQAVREMRERFRQQRRSRRDAA